MGKNAMLNWLENTSIPLSEISRKTGISRNTLYTWMQGKSDIRDSNYEKIKKEFGDRFERRDEMLETDYSYKTLLLEKVERQDHQIRELKSKIEYQNKKILRSESVHWDGVEHDFITEVKLTRSGFKLGRTVTSVSNLDVQTKMLGYNEDELNALWSVNDEYDGFKEHPVNAIVCNNTQKELHSISQRLPSLLDALKLMVGEHYIPVGINYINKDGSHVPAISYNKVMWTNLTVISKIKFLKIN